MFQNESIIISETTITTTHIGNMTITEIVTRGVVMTPMLVVTPFGIDIAFDAQILPEIRTVMLEVFEASGIADIEIMEPGYWGMEERTQNSLDPMAAGTMTPLEAYLDLLMGPSAKKEVFGPRVPVAKPALGSLSHLRPCGQGMRGGMRQDRFGQMAGCGLQDALLQMLSSLDHSGSMPGPRMDAGSGESVLEKRLAEMGL